MVSEARLRTLRAAKKARQAHERWDEVDTSWHRRTRCGLCKKTFVCNNYPDRVSRARRIRGMTLCPWCYYRPEIEFIVRAVQLVERMTKKDPPKWIRKHQEAKNGRYG